MGRVIVLALLALCFWGAAQAQLKGPAPGSGKAESRQPQTVPQSNQQQTAPDLRGTPDAPVVVKVLPTPKSKEESEQDQADRNDISAANWWMVRLTGAVGIIGAIQAWVFWIQASRLKKTISKMDEIATGQTADMAKMIEQNTKSATAMERVADGIVQQVTNSTTLMQNQREFWSRQMRAYLGVIPGAAFEQNLQPGSHFECQPFIQNDGLTPAYEVIYTARTALLPFPLPPNFDFALSTGPNPTRMTLNPRANSFMINVAEAFFSNAEYSELKQPGGRRLYTYGNIVYRDISGTERYTNFCFFFIWGGQGKPAYIRTDRHNDSN